MAILYGELTREQREGGCKFAPPYVFSNIFTTRANFNMMSKSVPQGSNSECFGVSRMNVAFSSIWSDMEKPRAPSMEKSDIFCWSI